MDDLISDLEAQVLGMQPRREFSDMLLHFTNTMTQLRQLYDNQPDSAQREAMARVLMELQDTFLGTDMLRRLSNQQTIALRALLDTLHKTDAAYAQGWRDRLADILKRSGDDSELRAAIERILNT